MNAESRDLEFTERSHVATLFPQSLGVDSGDEVEGVHVAVHAHGDAFLNDRVEKRRKFGWESGIPISKTLFWFYQ